MLFHRCWFACMEFILLVDSNKYMIWVCSCLLVVLLKKKCIPTADIEVWISSVPWGWRKTWTPNWILSVLSTGETKCSFPRVASVLSLRWSRWEFFTKTRCCFPAKIVCSCGCGCVCVRSRLNKSWSNLKRRFENFSRQSRLYRQWMQMLKAPVI